MTHLRRFARMLRCPHGTDLLRFLFRITPSEERSFAWFILICLNLILWYGYSCSLVNFAPPLHEAYYIFRYSYRTLLVFVTSSTATHRATIQAIFRYVNEKLPSTVERTSFHGPLMVVLLLVSFGTQVFTCLSNVFSGSIDEDVRSGNFHLWVFPFLDRIPSFTTYYVVFAFEVLLTSYYLIICYLPYLLLVSLITELKEILNLHCLRTQNLTNHIHRHLPIENYSEDDIIFLVNEQREFKRVIRSMKPYLERICTWVFLWVSFTIIVWIMKFLERGGAQLPDLLTLGIAGLYLCTVCDIGQQFSTMDEKITRNFFDIPWYQMKPKERKFFLAGLCQVREPLFALKIFKVLVVDLKSFVWLIITIWLYPFFTLLLIILKRKRFRWYIKRI